MTSDEVSRLAIQPSYAPPGPRFLALVVFALVAGLSWLSRAVAHAGSATILRRPRAVPVETPRHKSSSHR
jgi:hypothetical protein